MATSSLFRSRGPRIKWLLATCALTLIVIVGGYFLYSFRHEQNTRRLFELAGAARAEQRWSDANKWYRQYLNRREDDQAAIQAYGQVLVEQLKTQPDLIGHAVKVLQRVVRNNPQDEQAARKLHELYIRLGEFVLAEDLASAWVKTNPGSADAHIALAAARRGARRYDDAAKGLLEAVQRMPGESALYPPLIALYSVELNNLQEAGKWVEQGLSAGEDSYSIQMAAFAYQETRSNREGSAEALELAGRHLNRALELAPRELKVLLPAAAFMSTHHRVEDARALLNRAREVAPNDRGVLLARAALASQTRDFEEMASAADDLANQASETQPDLLARAAELYIAARQFPQADACMEKLASVTNPSPTLVTWIEALRGSRAVYDDRVVEGIPFLEEVLRRRPNDPGTMELLALAYVRADAVEAAVDMYQRLLNVTPRSAKARLGLARLELQQGRAAQALALLRDLTDADPAQQQQASLLKAACELRLADPRRRPALITELGKLAASPPPDDTAARVLANAFGMAGFPEALAEVVQARVGDPATGMIIADAYIRRLLEDGKLDEAGVAIEELQKRFPSAQEGPVLKTTWLAAMKRWDEAREYASGAAAPLQGMLFSVLGDQLAIENQTEAAAAAWKQAAELRPGDVGVRQKLIRVASSFDVADSYVDEIKRIEGGGGLTWRVERAGVLFKFEPQPDSKQEAIALLQHCMLARPGWLSTQVLLGNALESVGRFREAADTYQAAISQRPSLAAGSVALRLIFTLKRLGRFLEADAVLSRLAESNPASPDVLRLQTERFARVHDVPSAAVTAEKLLNMRADDSEWAAITADLWLRSGNAARSEQIARAALQKHEYNLPLQWSLARSLLAQRRGEEAAEFARVSAEAAPHGSRYLLLAQILVELGRKAEAEEAAAKAAEVGEDDSDVLAACSEFWAARGDREKQVLFARRALEKRGEDPAFSLLLAELLASGGTAAERAEANQIVERRLARDPVDAPAIVLQALMLGASEPPRLDEAAERLRRALEIDPQNLRAHRLIVATEIRRGRLTDAAEAAARALLIAPSHPELLLASAEIYSYRGDYELAIAPLRRILEIQPRHPGAVRLLANAYQNTGQADRAIEFLASQAQGEQLTAQELSSLARLHEAKQEYNKAEELYRQALPLTNESNESFEALLHYFARRGDFARVLQLSQERQASHPDDAASRLVAGHILGLKATDALHRKAGMDMLQELITASPEHAADAMYRLALCHYHALNDKAQAESLLLQAAERAPLAVEPVNALAWIYCEDMNRPADALGLIERFLGAGGRENAQMLDTHGMVLLRLGRAEESRTKFLTCIEVAGQTGTLTAATYHLGLALHELSRVEECTAKLKRARELDAQLGGLGEPERENLDKLLAGNNGVPRESP